MELAGVLGIMLVAQTLGQCLFAPFEVETPAWRKILKWTIVDGGTIGLYFVVGAWSLVFFGAMFIAGMTVHVIVCRREGFHPLRATPRRQYYAFRGWAWPE